MSEIIQAKPNILQIQPSFINTAEFSNTAAVFLRTGKYCAAPEGTIDFKQFWEEENKRCIEGYSVGGVRITGDHYRYLNFLPIKATEKDIATNKRKTGTKKFGFPRFLDMDYYFYHEKEAAKENGEGMIIGKARRKGFSYKMGAINEATFNLVPASICIIGAFEDTYAQSTMNMTLEMLNFINENCPRWRKRRDKINQRDHVRASYIERLEAGIEIEKGYKSEIFTVSFKNDPTKGIGKTANIVCFEEAGKWPKLKEAYQLMQPTFYDGDIAVGMPFIWGTGGDMESGTIDFADMFYNPELYKLRAYKNVWDEDAGEGSCGYFVDDTWYREPFVDENGNSDRQKAKESIIASREILRISGKRNEYEKLLSQSPLTPKEAFLQSGGNIFPVALLAEQLQKVTGKGTYKNLGQRGRLEWETTKKLRWIPDDSLEESPWPYDEKRKEGCIVIYEHPEDSNQKFKAEDGKEYTREIQLPYGLYIAGLDVYVQDVANDSSSYGSLVIYKKFWKAGTTYNIIVAEYTGRPETIEIFNENVRKLLNYYNEARVLYENMFTDVRTHFRNKGQEYLLLDQPSIIKHISPNSRVERQKGMHMNTQIKRTGEEYIRKWLLEERSKDEDGKVSLNLNEIYSVWLLKELISYSSNNGNFDRVMSFMMCVFHMEELDLLVVQEHEQIDRNKLFTDFFKHYEN